MTRGVLCVLLVCVLCVVISTAQLNFSPSWGKRAAGSLESCRGSMDTLMNLYKLVQSEAQKIVECEKFAN